MKGHSPMSHIMQETKDIGLTGITVADSKIFAVEGRKGTLIYRYTTLTNLPGIQLLKKRCIYCFMISKKKEKRNLSQC
jgi:citrate synthase